MEPIGAAGDAVPDVTELTRVVALDGPAGSGKSTVARQTARVLAWRFVDTGATYRAVTLHVLRAGVAIDDPEEVARVAATADVDLVVDPAYLRVTLAGEDVTADIRGPEVTAAVSAVAAVPAVRERLVLLQRRLMGTEGAVVEGRDIATVVAPFARLKVYLDAREEVRAQRRAREPEPGVRHSSMPTGGGLLTVQEALRHRDALDSQTNKLEVSEGGVHLDTSDLTLDEVVEKVVALAASVGLVTGT